MVVGVKRDNHLLQRNNLLLRQLTRGEAVTGEYTFVRRMLYADDPDALVAELLESLDAAHHDGVRAERERFRDALGL